MGKYKEQPKYNVLSIRVTDEEKAALEEMTRRDHISISNLMRNAIRSYIPNLGSLSQPQR